jgi:CheY-like chemotaxis protein
VLDIGSHPVRTRRKIGTTAILGSIADAFYSLDAEWRFVMVNPAAERAPFGRPARELLGKVIWDVPEIVLCDIGLPGMDGYAVARAFRADETLKDAHLVALSGYALPEARQRAFEAGFARHLAKPPSVEALEQLLSEV